MRRQQFKKDSGIAVVRNEFALERMEREKARRKRKERGESRMPYFNTNFYFVFVLYRGEDKYPQEKFMNSREANRRNKELRDKFITKLDANENARLWIWKVKNEDKYIVTRNKELRR